METQLVESHLVAEGTMAFRLAKPSGFTHRAGQSIDLTLPDPPETDAEGNTRAFSLTNDPADDTLMIATRMRDTAFKRVLRSLAPGAPLAFEGPFGDLVVPNRAQRTLVLLAGGIGITPFRPMALQAAREQLAHRIFLFYGNRRPEDAAFLDELQDAARRNARFTCVAVMSEMEKSARAWEGERGFITSELIARHLGDAPQPLYYMAGPPGMLAALRKALNTGGVDDDDIRAEEFSGY